MTYTSGSTARSVNSGFAPGQNFDALVSVCEIEEALQEGKDIKQWWDRAERVWDTDCSREGIFNETFELAQEYAGGTAVHGFFSDILVGGRIRPMAGIVSDFFYSQPKSQQHLSSKSFPIHLYLNFFKFFHRDLLHALSWTPPHIYPELGHLNQPAYLRAVSLTPPEGSPVRGAALSRICDKRAADRQVDQVPAERQKDLPDLTDLQEYEWIMMGTVIPNRLSFPMPGASVRRGARVEGMATAPRLAINLQHLPRLILSDSLCAHGTNLPSHIKLDAIKDAFRRAEITQSRGQAIFETLKRAFGRGHLASSEVARFDLGFAFLSEENSLADIPVGTDNPGLILSSYRISDDAKIMVRLVYITARDNHIRLSMNPVAWGLQAMNAIPFGATRKAASYLQKAADRLPVPSLKVDPLALLITTANILSAGRAESLLGIGDEKLLKEMLYRVMSLSRDSAIGTRTVWNQLRPDYYLGCWG